LYKKFSEKIDLSARSFWQGGFFTDNLPAGKGRNGKAFYGIERRCLLLLRKKGLPQIHSFLFVEQFFYREDVKALYGKEDGGGFCYAIRGYNV
jgi:hypothetical protein